jgi:carbon starvation protein CstA
MVQPSCAAMNEFRWSAVSLVLAIYVTCPTGRVGKRPTTITGVITAIPMGIVVGVLDRLLAASKQPIGMLLTIVVGIVSAFIGTSIARAIGIPL